MLDHERAQVAAVEHQDVGFARDGIETRKRTDQDAEGEAKVAGEDGRGLLALRETFGGGLLSTDQDSVLVGTFLALAKALTVEVIERVALTRVWVLTSSAFFYIS